MQRPQSKAVYRLTPLACSPTFLMVTRSTPLRNGAAHSELVLSTSINNKESAPQMCPQANLREATPLRRIKLTTKIRKSVVTYLFAKSCLLLSLEGILETMAESYGSLMSNVLKKK